MSGRLRVVIATTGGPSTVRRITPEDPDLRSVVCLAGTATALPISSDYDAFVRRPTGVVERDTGHRVYRVDVDHPIDEGRSWQLGLYVAHRLKRAGRLAEDEQPADGIVWATGTLDADLKVGPVDRVAEKARRSAPLFAAEPPVLAVAARENADCLPSGAESLAVRSVEEVLAHLGLTPVEAGRRRPTRRAIVVAAALLLASAGVIWGVRDAAWRRQEADSVRAVARASAPDPLPTMPAAGPPAPGPAQVSFDVLDSRVVGDACGAAIVVAPGAESAPGICAVAFRATNHGDRPVHFWLYGAVQGAVREYASRRRQTELAAGTLASGEAAVVRVQPPDWMRRAIGVRGLLITASGPRPQVDQALVSIDLLSAAEIEALAAGLRTLDLDLREIFHRVAPAR